MATANDSKRYLRLAPETTWGVLPGSPTWLVMKVSKVAHTPKTNIEFAEEIRNAPDMLYTDSYAAGGAIEEWDISFKIRADQFPHFLALMGFDDTKTTHAGETVVFDHLQKPGVGKSYVVQFYDGQVTHQGLGFVGTDFDLTAKAGETGTIEGSLKGWSKKTTIVSNPTPTLPGNTAYTMLKPTNTGVAITLGGGSANSMMSDWKLTYKREAKPLFTQTGTVDPYRPEYGKRQLDIEATLVFDDTADYTVAMTAPVVAKAFTIALLHTESAGIVPTKPSVSVNIPQFVYSEPKIDNSGASPKVTLKGKAMYDTTLAAQFAVTTTNEITLAY